MCVWFPNVVPKLVISVVPLARVAWFAWRMKYWSFNYNECIWVDRIKIDYCSRDLVIRLLFYFRFVVPFYALLFHSRFAVQFLICRSIFTCCFMYSHLVWETICGCSEPRHLLPRSQTHGPCSNFLSISFQRDGLLLSNPWLIKLPSFRSVWFIHLK